MTECWEWEGSRSGSRGYGCYSGLYIHRVAWAVTYGEVPPGMWVLHRCDNPPCFRPDHLFLGTCSDNVRDSVQKGRHSQTKKKLCPQGHPYVLRSHGRSCRACQASYARRKRANASLR